MSSTFDLRTVDERLTKVVDYAFGGWHHVHYKEHGVFASNPWCKLWVFDGLSSFDLPQLTRLILACHKWAVRSELVQSGPGRIGIILSCRVPDNGHGRLSTYERHPTIGQLIQQASELEARK